MTDQVKPIPMLLWCPMCSARHIDEGEFVTKIHATHACQNCGLPWRPAIEPTVGVQYLPGFKNGDPKEALRAALVGPKSRCDTQCVTFEAVQDRAALVAAIEAYLGIQ